MIVVDGLKEECCRRIYLVIFGCFWAFLCSYNFRGVRTRKVVFVVVVVVVDILVIS